VGAPGQALDAAFVSAQGGEFLAPVRIPDLDGGLGAAAAGQALAVRVQGQAKDRMRERVEGKRILAAGGVPDPEFAGKPLDDHVAPAAGKALAVPAPGHAEDRPGVSLEGEDFLAAVRIPDLHVAPDPRHLHPSARLLHVLAAAGGGDAFAVRAPGDAVDIAAGLDGEDLLALVGIPDPR